MDIISENYSKGRINYSKIYHRNKFCYKFGVLLTEGFYQIMEVDTLHHISLSKFKNLFPDSPYVGLGDDFYVMDIRLTDKHKPLGHPCRFDGYMLLYCVKGHIRLNVNLTEYDITEGMIFMNVPGNIIRVNELIDTVTEDVRYVCLAMSSDFVQGLHIDANKIFNEGMSMMENPSIRLRNDEMQLMGDGLALITKVVNSEMAYKKESLYSLISSMFYMLIGVWRDRSEDNVISQSTRSRMIFDHFIKLVTEYHTKYRNVGFYADKLCLTPKYLSKLIKNATGKSAPEWIDQYVILEAKNLLKYSSVTIKEIVYRLNFPNQSVFYKFFKARTGMTPTEYRNS